MNITSAKYVAINGVNDNVEVVIDGITMSVPMNEDNMHYAEILKQVADGTLTIKDADQYQEYYMRKHLYDLNPHLKPKPKEKAPEVKKGRPKKVKDEQANNDKS